MDFDISILAMQYVNPELVIAVPFLIFFGKQLKLSKRIDDTMIVNYLCYAGIGLAFIYNCSTKTPTGLYEWFMMVMVSAFGGIVLAYTAVGAHQQFKQYLENKANKTDV